VSSLDLSVDQARNGTHAVCVMVTMMSVHLVEAVIAPHSSDGVFDPDAPSGKSAVEGFVLCGPLPPAWFAPGRGA